MTNPLAQDLGGVVLLPCPFCGGRGEVGGLIPWVECQACEASGPQAETEGAAITAWNTRTNSAEIAGALRDAKRWREVANKAWFVDAAANVYDLHQRANSWEPSLADEDDVAAAIDTAMQQGGGGGDG